MTQAEGVHDPVQEAHGELALARIALAGDDLHHAANHLAGAIAHAPSLPEVHELLAALAARSPDGGLSLFPLDDRPFLGAVVAHAHLRAASDVDGALSLLAKATAFDPAQPWADVSWVRALPGDRVDPDAFVQVLVTLMRELGEPAAPEVRRANAAYLELATRVMAAHPQHAMLHGAAAGVGRRLGDPAQAARWGETAYRLEPTKLTAVWYAYALRAAGRLPDALAVMAEARRQNPLDLDLNADVASWLSDAGRLDEALSVIEDAMRIDPTYDCAVHTAYRLRFQRDGDPQHLVALSDFVRTTPQTSHDHTDLADCCDGRTWLGIVAGPSASCINVLGQFPADQRDSEGEIGISGLEPPSALAIFRREMPNVSVSIAGDPPPDMVQPLRPGRVLWQYAGFRADPAVPPPSARATALLAELASGTWPDPVSAYDHALPLGELPLSDLLGLLVYPPPVPDRMAGIPDGWWERSAQTFAALGILHCRELAAEPGDTTAQRAVLAEIAYGVEDWTTEAALFALVVAAWLDPGCRTEVGELVGRRFLAATEASQQRPVTILSSLAHLVRLVPDVNPELGRLADTVLADEADDDADRPAAEIPEQPKKRSLLRRLTGR
ncbi:MAG: tetratricopeptide repeat protein [Hamadaea sp.]|uniref:tetratricopeptide repeat protein n=1 Tax=Hamadaea sp. TaxID=2024425 RepID=UPI0017FA64C6|nr:tetratricopeptide repeat protein [Hamadaea sp.]NUR69781.1 tetratricopeptide repeat protein [Hamadaea sp.]NUT22636.1 tetratricopeptide repeat protein [Hamadaea sp.]